MTAGLNQFPFSSTTKIVMYLFQLYFRIPEISRPNSIIVAKIIANIARVNGQLLWVKLQLDWHPHQTIRIIQ